MVADRSLHRDRQLADDMAAEHVGRCLRRVGKGVRLRDDHTGFAGLQLRGERAQVLAPDLQVTNRTFGEPSPMSAARAILGNPAKSPPVLPTLLGMNTPPGASTRANASVPASRPL